MTSKVIVKYIVPGDNGKVSEDKIIEGKIGEEYYTIPPDNVDNDYKLIKVYGDSDGIITQEAKTIKYIYKTKNDAEFDETDSKEEKKGKDNKATVALMVKTGLDINNVLRMIGVGITLTVLLRAMR